MKPLGDSIIVHPHYDSEKLGSLYIPESASNPQSQQGEVLAVGPKQEDIEVGDEIIYQPYQGTEIEEDEQLLIQYCHVVGWIAPDGEAFPLPDAVMILPDWDDYTGAMIRPAETFRDNPRTSGTCIRRGEKVGTIEPGQYVFYPPGAGFEVGISTTVYYFIKERDILAICQT